MIVNIFYNQLPMFCDLSFQFLITQAFLSIVIRYQTVFPFKVIHKILMSSDFGLKWDLKRRFTIIFIEYVKVETNSEFKSIWVLEP